MATYKIYTRGEAGYQVEATNEGGMRHVCGGLATEFDAEMWIATHKRILESVENQAARRDPAPRET